MDACLGAPHAAYVLAALATCGACMLLPIRTSTASDATTPEAAPTDALASRWSTLLGCCVYVLHPLTLVAVLLDDTAALLENASFAVAFAACRRQTWVPALLATAAAVPFSPLQAGFTLTVVLMCAASSMLWPGVPRSWRASLCPGASGTAVLVMAAAAAAALRHQWERCRPAPDPLLSLQFNPAALLPELAVGWYLFSEAFARYLPYFSELLWLLPLAYALPLAMSLRRAPAAAMLTMLGLVATFDPSNAYTLARFPLVLSLAISDGEACARTRSAWFWLPVAHLAVAAGIIMKHVWVVARMGNANLLFNMQIVLALACGTLLTDFAGAARRATKGRQVPTATNVK
jgi:hypothetical protein